MDNYLAEVSDEDNSTGPTPPKQGRHLLPVIYKTKFQNAILTFFILANISKTLKFVQLQKLLSKC